MRLYMTPTEISESVLGQSPAIANILSNLGTGVLEKMIARASARCDSYTRKRLQAPPTTIVGLGGIAAGGTTLPVSSTLGFDSLSEQAVQIGTGGTQEIIPIMSGGVTTSSYTAPYVGTLTLAQPCIYAHSFGEPVVGLYQEIATALSSSSDDPFNEAFTQEAQLAQAHAPLMAQGTNFTRMIFLKAYPIINIVKMEYTYSYDNAYYPLQVNSLAINPASGIARVRTGTVITPGGLIRATYSGGYVSLPEDIKEAVLLLLRDELIMYNNPFGLASQTQGKRSQSYRNGGSNALEAEAILKRYRRNI